MITGASYCLERLVSETSSFIHHLLPCFENSDMPVYIVGFFWSLGGILSPDACPGTASDSPEWEFAWIRDRCLVLTTISLSFMCGLDTTWLIAPCAEYLVCFPIPLWCFLSMTYVFVTYLFIYLLCNMYYGMLSRKFRVGWFGHVEHKEDADWMKCCRTVQVHKTRWRGHSRKSW